MFLENPFRLCKKKTKPVNLLFLSETIGIRKLFFSINLLSWQAKLQMAIEHFQSDKSNGDGP